MPTRKSSVIKIIGTINGVSHYIAKGKPQTRKSSPPTKDQIYNDPRFASVRANNKEFGGASIISKAICTGLQANVKTFKDRRFTSRLTGICRKIIQKGGGSPGQREANLFNDPEALLGFQLHKNKIFSKIFTATPTIAVNDPQNTITVTIAKSTPNNLKQYPKTATHFSLTAAISTVSTHNWHQESQKYQPQHPEQNGLGTTVHTTPLLCKIEHQNIILQLPTPIKNDSHLTSNYSRLRSQDSRPKTAITIWLGISFGKEENIEFRPFQTAKAMECIGVV
ncbi:MAG: hypothetical protein V7655_00685 [Aequorivita antarctica]